MNREQAFLKCLEEMKAIADTKEKKDRVNLLKMRYQRKQLSPNKVTQILTENGWTLAREEKWQKI